MDLNLYTWLFILSAIGVSTVSYLIGQRLAAERPVCPIGDRCHEVLESKYNRLFFGLHNDVLGFLFFVATASIMAAIVILENPAFTAFAFNAFQMMLGLATIMSLIFFYLQWQVIRAWCFWCLKSTGLVLLMDLIVVISKL